MPRANQAKIERPCHECGAMFKTTRDDQRFCSKPHRWAFANRMAGRGKILTPYVLAWVQGRGGGNTDAHPVAGVAMKELTQIARGFLDEDKAAGRPPATDYLEIMLSDGFLYCDRAKGRR